MVGLPPPPAHAVDEKIHFLVSLSTLSNQCRELHQEAVLSARSSFLLLSGDYHCDSCDDVEKREGDC